ncbi:YggT family protein [Psychromicrobium sp. YIM B11713]|uniref:YggT family protein n=1 Tax=Psychromicrobium sp. YIM B11713 TaxID=3145233 RepID=UPI00374EA88D
MGLIFTLLSVLLLLFYLTLVVRLIFDLVQQFARDWRPKGASLVAATGVYSITDPPLKLLRRLLPPVNLGGVSLDLAWIILWVAIWIAMVIVGNFAA